jgi:hypothetical protein
MMTARRAAMASAGFTPASLSGLAGWWKADQLVLNDGDPVATWADQSGNSRDFSQATSAARPTYKTNILNGKPVVRSDGVDDYLNTTSFTMAQALTLSVVHVPRSVSTTDVLFDAGSGSQFTAYHNASAAYILDIGASTNTSGGPVLNTPEIVTVVANGASSAYVRNGVSTAASGTNGLAGGLRLMANRILSAAYNQGDYAEVILYNRALTVGERQQVEAYANAKYALGF